MGASDESLDDRPLFGKRILVTRSQEQAGDLVALLAKNGATPIILPTVSIQPLADYRALDAAIDRLSSYKWMIFTSVNGVAYFFSRLSAIGRDVRDLQGVKICAVGPATAKALTDQGLLVDYVPTEYIAESVVAGLKTLGVVGERVLLPRALEAREVIVKELSAAGALLDDIPVYQTVRATESAEQARQLFASHAIDIATFTSSSTVRSLLALLDGDVAALQAITIACIGPATAQTARDLGLSVSIVASEHTVPGLVRAIVEFVKERAR